MESLVRVEKATPIVGIIAIGAIGYGIYDWYTNGFSWYDLILIGAGILLFPVPKSWMR